MNKDHECDAMGFLCSICREQERKKANYGKRVDARKLTEYTYGTRIDCTVEGTPEGIRRS